MAANSFFPAWYQDTDGLALDLCLSAANIAPGAVPGGLGGAACTLLPNPGIFDPALPLVFPATARDCPNVNPALCNFPDESCWFMADTAFTISGVDVPYGADLEAAFAALTDYVQHKYAPQEAEARRFYAELGRRFGRLTDLGAVVALTADHGMNDKSTPEGRPNVIWLQDILDSKFGKGDTKVICPITDAFVAHHGALGGFVRVWSRGKATPAQVIEALRLIKAEPPA